MRIIVASPSKTGNVWAKFLLAKVYRLKVLEDVPRIPIHFLKEFVENGRFKDNAIFHQHFRPTEPFFDLVRELDAHLVTTIRHPYDVFVSLYFYIQQFPQLFAPGTQFYPLVGKPIDDEEVFDYLKRGEKGFGRQVNLAVAWVDSGRSIQVRYEDLVADTDAALKQVTDRIAPVSLRRIQRAVQLNRAAKMRKKSNTLTRHIRKATSGDWRNHLTPAHLEAINSVHGSQIERLGYSLHQDPAA